ncbi:MAG: hypothetical protein CM1200mP20_04860 [Pseudomonadota bacterium]|nr:MAG: hypothetical protein CM1200mP20_04860 [Pseudomonadota bacterium]
MATVGMLFFIEEIVVHATDGMPLPYPAMPFDEYFWLGDFSVRGDLLLVDGICVLATALLMYMLYRTRLGIATRAVAQQPIAARLAGISIEKTNAVTFVMTGLLGGLAGAMIGASVSVLSPLIFIPVTVKGLIVTVIGGLGSIPGAIVAGCSWAGLRNSSSSARCHRAGHLRHAVVVSLPYLPAGRNFFPVRRTGLGTTMEFYLAWLRSSEFIRFSACRPT